MERRDLITAVELCSSYNIELSFLLELKDNGLIEFEIIGDEIYINQTQLPDLERIVTLHFDLEINLQGIETIIHLLRRSEKMQNEIVALRNRLSFYESL